MPRVANRKNYFLRAGFMLALGSFTPAPAAAADSAARLIDRKSVV